MKTSSHILDAQPTMETGTFNTVQLLRLFAALMVVLTHSTFYISTRIDEALPVWSPGTQGVQVFFVISGFVMALTSRPLLGRAGGWKRFIASRTIRIVPLYWVLNLLKIIQIFLIPTIAFANPDIGNIVLSLFFIPSRNSVGEIETFYGVGWTLNFEMFFYLMFGAALLWRLRVIPFVGAVLLLATALSVLRQESWPAITYLLNPIVLNFLWGILIAEVVFAKVNIPAPISAAMVALGFVAIFAYPHLPLLGIQYALLVAGMIFLEGRIGPMTPKLLTFGGDASYSLYLVHPMVGVFVAIVLSKLEITSAAIGVTAIIAVSLLVASATYVFFERPVTRYLRARFLPSPVTRGSIQRDLPELVQSLGSKHAAQGHVR